MKKVEISIDLEQKTSRNVTFSDLKEAINNLLDGKELVVKTDPLNNWQLVEETLLNESIQSQDEQVTIFDLTGLKVELDDDYFFDENEEGNIFEDDSSSLATTEQEVDPMAWHPVEKKGYQGIYFYIHTLWILNNDFHYHFSLLIGKTRF